MSAVLKVRVSAGQIEARGGAASAPWTMQRAFAAPVELTQILAELVQACREHHRVRALRVEVGAALLQRRTLSDLPPVRPAALRELVARSGPRYFRQNGHSLTTDAIWLRGGAGGRGSARAVAMDEVLAEAIVAGARAAPVRLLDIVPGEDGCGLSLLPATERARRHRGTMLSLARLGTAVAALWVVTLLIVLALLSRRERAVGSELARLAAARSAIVEARRQVHQAAAMVEAIGRAERRRTVVLSRLADTVLVLPKQVVLREAMVPVDGPLLLVELPR
ncbi:MAG: hypothetical protein OEV95_06865 [Gemmatimonadota bacterium]|nr:hypothetical protein [Gemmatimonadota bacterium]MDH5284397.1 hypothetical protein [Gemmatimonadota bacterium]